MTCLVLKYVCYEVVVRNDTCLFHWVMWLENLRHVFSNCILILLTVNWLDVLKCF